MTKADFLLKYNSSCSVAEAIGKSINAALGRNPLYTAGLKTKRRKAIRQFWAELLIELTDKYKAPQTEEQFINDVLELQRRMNEKFFTDMQCTKDGYAKGFRISHAQKSLSVFLKHLWCMGLIPEPPVCPIDRNILRTATGKNNVASWGKVNTIDEYKKQLDLVRKAADGKTLAQWELEKF